MIYIFTKDYCPYCDMAKELLSLIGQTFQEIDVSEDIQKLQEISLISGMRTVPQIYVNEISKENCLWGYSDIKKMYDEWVLLSKLQK